MAFIDLYYFCMVLFIFNYRKPLKGNTKLFNYFLLSWIPMENLSPSLKYLAWIYNFIPCFRVFRRQVRKYNNHRCHQCIKLKMILSPTTILTKTSLFVWMCHNVTRSLYHNFNCDCIHFTFIVITFYFFIS